MPPREQGGVDRTARGRVEVAVVRHQVLFAQVLRERKAIADARVGVAEQHVGQWVRAQAFAVQVARIDRRRRAGAQHVDLAAAQRVHVHLVVQRHLKVQPGQGRLFAQLGVQAHEVGRDAVAHAGHGKAQAAFGRIEALDRLERLAPPGHDGPQAPHDLMAPGREPIGLAMPHVHVFADRRAQPAQRLARRRRRHAQPGSGLTEALRLDERAHQLQLPHVGVLHGHPLRQRPHRATAYTERPRNR